MNPKVASKVHDESLTRGISISSQEASKEGFYDRFEVVLLEISNSRMFFIALTKKTVGTNIVQRWCWGVSNVVSQWTDVSFKDLRCRGTKGWSVAYSKVWLFLFSVFFSLLNVTRVAKGSRHCCRSHQFLLLYIFLYILDFLFSYLQSLYYWICEISIRYDKLYYNIVIATVYSILYSDNIVIAIVYSILCSINRVSAYNFSI